ncbi:hypothetical protein M758_12G037600 [Ceratodon purpureus]|nr:hypothetical protein M758_12G037600 [Ceratodon purpureus]
MCVSVDAGRPSCIWVRSRHYLDNVVLGTALTMICSLTRVLFHLCFQSSKKRLRGW